MSVGAGEVTKPDDLSSIPTAYMMEKENSFRQVDF